MKKSLLPILLLPGLAITAVSAVARAVEKVPGFTGHTAVKGVKIFEVSRDFSPKAVFAAIQAAGLTGKAGH